jgi:hypothetical protein
MSRLNKVIYWIFMAGVLTLSIGAFYMFFSDSVPAPHELTEIRGHLKNGERTNMKITDDGFWVDFTVEEYPKHRFRWESVDRSGSSRFSEEAPGTPLVFSVLKKSFPPERESSIVQVIYLSTSNANYMDPSKLAKSNRMSALVTGFLTFVLFLLAVVSYFKKI